MIEEEEAQEVDSAIEAEVDLEEPQEDAGVLAVALVAENDLIDS